MAFALALVATVALTVAGCKIPVETVSASERMDMFKADVNSQNLGNLTDHLHSDVGGAPNEAFWETYFDGVTNFSHVTIGSTATANCSTGVYVFSLAQEETAVYKITDIKRNGSSIFSY
jgi:hypothetical protein